VAIRSRSSIFIAECSPGDRFGHHLPNRHLPQDDL